MLLFVHGVRETAASLDSSTRFRRALFAMNINKRLRRRYKYEEVRWFHLSRRADLNVLLDHPGARHLDINAHGGTDEYIKELERRLAGNSQPNNIDYVDYLALKAADHESVKHDYEMAGDAIAEALNLLAKGHYLEQIQTRDDIRTLANELKVVTDSVDGRHLDAQNLIGDVLAKATRLFDGVKRPAYELLRDNLAPIACDFTADTFSYLITRGGSAADNIGQHVADEILHRVQDAGKEHPIILLGHSFGGVILYDLLSTDSFSQQLTRITGTRPIILVTVGSQIGLFNGIGFYTSQHGTRPTSAFPIAPSVCKRWLNIYDKKDLLGYTIGAIPKSEAAYVDQYNFDTNSNPVTAHSSYLDSEHFWARLGIRLQSLVPP